MLKNSPYLTWIKDRNGVYVDVNDKFLEFFDKTYDEVIGKTDYAIMPKDFAKEIIDQDNDVMKNNKMNTYEDTHILNKNKLGYLQSTKWPLSEDDNNIILGTIGIAIEITNKVEMFKSMEKNEKIFLEIANNIEEAIIIIDEKKAQYISPSFKKMFDVNPDELYNDISSWRENGNKVVYENYPKPYDFKGINDFMFKLYQKGREEMWIWGRFVPILDEEGNTIKKIGILSDITERKTLESELEKLRMDFFANLSHELRTPINLIISALQVLGLRMDNLDDEDFEYFEKYFKIINQNSNRLLKLVNNLIDTTKLDSGCFSYNPKNNDIVSCIEDICLSVSGFIEDNNLSIIFDTDTEEKIIGFDLDKMERIVLNLLSNALKFNEKGKTIQVTIKNYKNSIKISVKDEGIGIPKHDLHKIFDRFKQVKHKSVNSKVGSGIGLSLVKSLVELHKGSIEVKSVLGEGSEFIISIPNKLYNNKLELIDETILKEKFVQKIDVEFSDIYA